jgi:hypothetical protein
VKSHERRGFKTPKLKKKKKGERQKEIHATWYVTNQFISILLLHHILSSRFIHFITSFIYPFRPCHLSHCPPYPYGCPRAPPLFNDMKALEFGVEVRYMNVKDSNPGSKEEFGGE